MKQNNEQMGPDYFRLYLIGHLRDHWFPQYTDKRFIEERTEAAYDKFTEMRKDGHDVPIAQEMAMRILLEGIYVSRYDIIYNVVEENLWTRLPDYLWHKCTLHFLAMPEIHAVLDRYQVNGDFLSRETHWPMLLELLGLISEILDGYGLQ